MMTSWCVSVIVRVITTIVGYENVHVGIYMYMYNCVFV